MEIVLSESSLLRFIASVKSLCLVSGVILASPVLAENLSSQEQCLLDVLTLAEGTMTVAQIRAQCTDEPQVSTTAIPATTTGVINERIAAEAEVLALPFVLTAHRPNYILPYTYNRQPNKADFRLINPDRAIDIEEAQFQLSFKFPVAHQFLGPKNDLFFGFTSRAWWQAYNTDISSPFRETDYEPEFFLRHQGGPQFGPIKIAGWDLGLAHQSNGQSNPLSRSWNRVNANIALEADNVAIALRTWYRIPETLTNDDNPDLHRYLGYGDVRFLYRQRSNVFTAMFRPSTEKVSYELTWSRPLWQQLRMYLTYFDGYGESLLDYKHHNRRIGIGIGLNDYLETSDIAP